jgi:hypothetical protein
MQNALSFLPRRSPKPEVVTSLRAVFDAPDQAIAVEKYRTAATGRSGSAAIEDLEHPGAIEPGDRAADDGGTLFPNDASALRLVSALLMEIREHWDSNRRSSDDRDEVSRPPSSRQFTEPRLQDPLESIKSLLDLRKAVGLLLISRVETSASKSSAPLSD